MKKDCLIGDKEQIIALRNIITEDRLIIREILISNVRLVAANVRLIDVFTKIPTLIGQTTPPDISDESYKEAKKAEVKHG